MSFTQPPHESLCVQRDLEKTETDQLIEQSKEHSTTNPTPHSSDTSIPLFALYLRRAEKHDWRRSKLLKGDTSQILLFCGLFSAALAALVVPLIPESSITYDLNTGTDMKYTQTLDAASTATMDVIISFWYWSLITSILCATMALSIQRWAKPNFMVTSPRYSLPEQARLHSLFSAGSKRLKPSLLIELLHGLVHISLALFLVGLGLFFNTLAVPYVVVGWSVIFSVAYVSLTVLPVLRPGFPCSTPFSPAFAFAYACVVRGTSQLFYWATSLICLICKGRATQGAVHHPKPYYRGWNLWKFAEDKARRLAPQFDGDILKRTLYMLESDDDLEQFFDAIPGFCASKIVHDPRQSLDILGQQRLAEALIGFWNRTLSSNLVSESIKGRRLVVCLGAIEAANLAIAAPGPGTLRDLSFRYLGGIARSVEVGHSLGNLRQGNVASLARGIIASIISNAERGDRWGMLAMDELGISRGVFQGYLARGDDSVLLANLIHITRHFFHALLQPHPDLTREALSILSSVSKFDILNTLPELQHDFCALWNDVVLQVRGGDAKNCDDPFIEILLDIWGFYAVLHGTTASNYDPLRPPIHYPLCDDECHRNLITHVQ